MSVRGFDMKYNRFMSIALIGTVVCIFLFNLPAGAIEPQRPKINKSFSQAKESRIQALKSRNTKEVFDGLKDVEFLLNRNLTYKAIHSAFNNRREEAIAYAQNCLRLPLIEYVNGRRISRFQDFNTAKMVFEVFPDEAIPVFTSLYNQGDGFTRGNIVRASGKVAGGKQIKGLLARALEDKSFAEEETPEISGEPLRVCDMAYNQIVLRYGVRNVLRTISPAHKIETRDYHIDMLKALF
jgi:hypothetical protein